MTGEHCRVAANRQGLLAKAVEFLRLKEGQDIERKQLLQGQTSAIVVDLLKDGGLKSRRLDLLISAGGKSKGHMHNPSLRTPDLALGEHPWLDIHLEAL